MVLPGSPTVRRAQWGVWVVPTLSCVLANPVGNVSSRTLGRSVLVVSVRGGAS